MLCVCVTHPCLMTDIKVFYKTVNTTLSEILVHAEAAPAAAALGGPAGEQRVGPALLHQDVHPQTQIQTLPQPRESLQVWGEHAAPPCFVLQGGVREGERVQPQRRHQDGGDRGVQSGGGRGQERLCHGGVKRGGGRGDTVETSLDFQLLYPQKQ